MELNEQWLPIIMECLKWVKAKMKPTKNELKLRISDLEEQVKSLSYGNQLINNNIELIMSIIIAQLKSEGQYTINADTIIHISGNNGQVNIIKDDKVNNILCNVNKNSLGHIFDDIDEEIKLCKLMRPSERRE